MALRRSTTWQKLGSPTSPCVVYVEGVGNVNVRQENIDHVAGTNGRFRLELADATHLSSEPDEFIIVGMEPY